MPNGLVPQAPIHTDSLTIYETCVEIIHTQEEGESREIRKPVVTATAVVEQRISHFLMGLALIGTMTGPLLIVLHMMPSAVFGGVFFVVGVSLSPPNPYFHQHQADQTPKQQWGSIESNGILTKLTFLQSERRFLQPSNALTTIRRRKILLYIGLQILGVAVTVAISQTIAAIGFPVLIIALIPLRTFLMPRWFTRRELDVLDDLTANNKAVLASLGGAPTMGKGDDEEDEEARETEGMNREGVIARSTSAVRQRMGSIMR
jgi:hypothetical protein